MMRSRESLVAALEEVDALLEIVLTDEVPVMIGAHEVLQQARRVIAQVHDELLQPGRYRSPDGVEGLIHGFDPLACHYSFEPDGFVPPAIVGPGIKDQRTMFGRDTAHLWTRIGDLP